MPKRTADSRADARRSLAGRPATCLMLLSSLCWAVGANAAKISGSSNDAPLTVDEAVAVGLKANPQVKGALAGAEALLATSRALAVPAPLNIGFSEITGTTNAASLTNNDNDSILDLAGTIDTSGQRRYQAAGANANYRATRYQYLETQLNLEQQIRDAYWTLAAAEAQERIGDVSLNEARRIYDLTVEQEKAGSAPHSDVVRSSIDVANARQTLLIARNARNTGLLAFNTLLGRAPGTPEVLAANLSDQSPPTPTLELLPAQDLGKAALANRPIIKSAGEQARAANYAVRQAESSRLPDLTVLYQRSVVENVDAWTLSISLPLFDFGGIGQTIRSAREQRRQAEARKSQTEQEVARQVALAHADLQTAVEAATDYRKEILDPSATLLDMAKTGYQNGATGMLPVIDAESTLRNARVGYINALLAIYKAQDELLGAVGRPGKQSQAAAPR